MNTNIEVINPHLWAVKFSWLPWISDISIELDSSIPIEHEIYRIIPKGIMVLNMDNEMFPLYAEQFPIFQKKKLKELKHKRDILEKVASRNFGQELYLAIVLAELNRREIMKGVKHNGKHSKYN